MTILERLAQKNGVDREIRMTDLKRQLAETDYKAIKYAEGWITEAEYAPIRAMREDIREQIRRLEGEV